MSSSSMVARAPKDFTLFTILIGTFRRFRNYGARFVGASCMPTLESDAYVLLYRSSDDAKCRGAARQPCKKTAARRAARGQIQLRERNAGSEFFLARRDGISGDRRDYRAAR